MPMKVTNKMKLGVLPYGDDKGFPFDILFEGIKFISRPKDFGGDALLFWGGTDIWAGFYGEEPNTFNQNQSGPSVRDNMEWALMGKAIKEGIPIIGVCRGAQMLCAYSGGSLIQHVDNHVGIGVHKLSTFDNQVNLYGNSCHHQMMRLPESDDVELLAWTNGLSSKAIGEGNNPVPKLDKEPEIVHFKKLNAIGIQGHPEWMERGSSFVDYCLDLVKERLL